MQATRKLLCHCLQRLQAMGDSITAQVSDLRSIVVKEACATIRDLATALGDQFAPLAGIWTPTLLRQM